MQRTVEAIFEGGVFKPLERVDLEDQQRVRLIVESEHDVAQRELAAWEEVYDGLSDSDVAEVHKLVTDRSDFMRPER